MLFLDKKGLDPCYSYIELNIQCIPLYFCFYFGSDHLFLFGPFCCFAPLFMHHVTYKFVIKFFIAVPCGSRLPVLFSVLKYLFEGESFEKVKTTILVFVWKF